ncbi:NAD(P)/FAD-dependent oxidoreductase [Cohnella caldifontis]|uniref:NAD(P)/FAD-dependent oxidoreductase n=1 Tax=Cohnella caldifontis TaxID=3027471 RepID=UPI0023ED5A7E|nr:NAD(P)/FAD-dependent oxidoreductase [Cohnella sp. YIM B05605]
MYDCAIIGGGPAGLNAALVLGRARRTVVLFDDRQARNKVTHASHGFITRDGIEPGEFRRIALDEIQRYPSVRFKEETATDIRRTEEGFEIRSAGGETIQARKTILAAGLKEEFPEIPGLRDFYGRSLFNCPYCDGWELRDQPLVLLSEDERAAHMAKILYNWSRDLIICTNGRRPLTEERIGKLASRGIRVIETPVTELYGQSGKLEQVRFADGSRIERTGGFVTPKWIPKASSFAEQLGCETTDLGAIRTDAMGKTGVPGLFAAGDAAYVGPSQLIYAAASGSKAAMMVNADLTDEDFPDL